MTGVGHDALERVAILLTPARRDGWRRASSIADLDVRACTEIPNVPRRLRRTRLGLLLQFFESVRQGGPHRKRRMRDVGRRLASPDVDVNEMQMTAERTCGGECRLQECP